jgi:pimeloyl-ACP methyl ester carboxylesterase
MIPEPRLVASDRGTLAVREWSDGGDVPFVFWHALGPCASGAELVEVAPRLAAAGFRPVSVDGPGFGASPLAPGEAYRLEALAELLRATAAALGLERPVLMGHSWGGGVVTTLAALHPEETRALVLVDSGHIDYADLFGTIYSPDPVTWEWESREAFRDWLRENLDRVTPEVLAGYEAGVAEVNGRIAGSPAEAARRARAGLLDRLSPRWPRLGRVPVLLFLATEQPHRDQNRQHVGRFAEAVPHADIRWVEGATHGLIADVGPPLGDEIAAWVGADQR